MSQPRPRHLLYWLLAICALGLPGSGCLATPSEPPVATPLVTLSHDRAPAGSPLEITYRFDVADGVSFDEDYRVMAHVVDIDQERMWTDDHDPPRADHRVASGTDD